MLIESQEVESNAQLFSLKFLAPLRDLSGGGLAGMLIERQEVNLMHIYLA